MVGSAAAVLACARAVDAWRRTAKGCRAGCPGWAGWHPGWRQAPRSACRRLRRSWNQPSSVRPWTAAPPPARAPTGGPRPTACTDAERRAALALLRRLRRARRSPRVEARWVRPGWPAWQALCAVAGVVGAVLSVDHPLAGLIVAAGAFALSVAHGRGLLPLGRARATQDVVARAREPRAVALIVLAAVDR